MYTILSKTDKSMEMHSSSFTKIIFSIRDVATIVVVQ